jgi:uncharacterized protein (TIGR03435 family)
VLVLLSTAALEAQDLSGNWQGTLSAGGRDLRIVVKLSKAPSGDVRGIFYSIDQPGPGVPSGTITVSGSNIKMPVPGIGGTYEGKLNPEGNAIAGTWSQGPGTFPLNLTRATAETAWAIPEPPPPPKAMAPDANPTFEVAVIKLAMPGVPGKGFRVQNRRFTTINTSVSDLIQFAYGIHPRQITNAPDWIGVDKFDITAQPDGEGQPNDRQWKMMMQKLLADRFKLTFHHDKKELSVYAITVTKTGAKLTPNTGDPNGLPGLGFGQLGRFQARNANMQDFANTMQSTALDRPVVDHTGLSGRYDFTLSWVPDEFQFPDLKVPGAPQIPSNTDGPDLFTAFQQQLGLKLDSTKEAVDVIAIDHVEKPSEN